jgi:hypothetical protein
MDLAPAPELGAATFVYSPGVTLGDIEVVGGRLTATRLPELARTLERAGSPVDVAVSDFDRFVIVGLELSLGVCASVYGRFLPYDRYPARRFDINAPQLISKSCMDAAITGLIERTGAIRVARQLRTATDRPIYIVPQPNPIEELKSVVPQTPRQKRAVAKWTPLFPEAIATEMYDVFLGLARRVAAPHRITVLGQPAETLSAGFTRAIYKREKQDDVRHTNAAFGRDILRSLTHVVMAQA